MKKVAAQRDTKNIVDNDLLKKPLSTATHADYHIEQYFCNKQMFVFGGFVEKLKPTDIPRHTGDVFALTKELAVEDCDLGLDNMNLYLMSDINANTKYS